MTTELVHMVFALDQESEPTPDGPIREYIDNWYNVTKCAMDLSRPQTQFERQVFRAVEAAEHLQSMLSGTFCKLCHLASTLVAGGYRCSIREALGGGRGCASFENLRHEYLLVSNGSETIVVDPHFRAQFSVAAPTACYSAALQIPERFVGSMARLTALVTFLCGEMAASFKVMGFTMPPWRQRRAMMSKWLPVRARTHRVLPEGSVERPASSHCTQTVVPVDGAAVSDRSCLLGSHERLESATEPVAQCSKGTTAARQQLPAAATPVQAVLKGRGYLAREMSVPETKAMVQCIGGNQCSCSSCEVWQQLTGEKACSLWPPIRTVKMRGRPVIVS